MLTNFLRTIAKPNPLRTITKPLQPLQTFKFPVYKHYDKKYSTWITKQLPIALKINDEPNIVIEKWNTYIKNIEPTNNNEIKKLLEKLFQERDILIWNNILNNIEFNTIINSFEFKKYLRETDNCLFLILENIYFIKDILSVKNSRGFIWYSYYKEHVPYYLLFTVRYKHWDEFNDICNKYRNREDTFDNDKYRTHFISQIKSGEIHNYIMEYLKEHDKVNEMNDFLTLLSENDN